MVCMMNMVWFWISTPLMPVPSTVPEIMVQPVRPNSKLSFPTGYRGLTDKASKIGTRFGIWGGPDGFGNTAEEENQRIEMMVSLCRDYKFELFKFDAVCGDLRNNKQDAFIRMMTECRKYSPDLVLLNHRLNLGEEGN